MDLPPLTQARPRLSRSGVIALFERYEIEIRVNGQSGLVTTLLVQRAH
jgi:hypothetical protein